MNSTAERNVYATESTPQLGRHHWQIAAELVSSFRPEWNDGNDEVIQTLWASRDLLPFPELVKVALAAALDPRCKTAASIRMAAAGVISL